MGKGGGGSRSGTREGAEGVHEMGEGLINIVLLSLGYWAINSNDREGEGLDEGRRGGSTVRRGESLFD